MMPGVRLATALAAMTMLGAPGAALADPSVEPGHPPRLCASDYFADQIGTNADDELTSGGRAERLYGLAGDDVLAGSQIRATCEFGGRGDDVLDLRGGGGIAWGEDGSDIMRGSPLADQFLGGDGIDQVQAGAGDDRIEAVDGRAEVVDCGPGRDRAIADRVDVLIACEKVTVHGPAALRLTPEPRASRAGSLVRVGMTLPRAGGPGSYRIVLVTAANDDTCASGPVEITRFPVPGRRVRRGQKVRVGLRPPEGGWCAGIEKATVVYYRRAALPGEPVARLQFTAAR